MRTPVTTILRTQGETVVTRPDQSVFEAVKTMSERNVGSILIADEKGCLEGIFTERDLLRRVTACGLDPSSTPISDVMTTDVLTVDRNVYRQDVHHLMKEHHVRHIPVVSANKILGVISLRDVLRSENEEKSIELEHLRGYVSEKPYPSYPG